MSDYKPSTAKLISHIANATKLIGPEPFDVKALQSRSAIPIPDNPADQFGLALTTLFHPDEIVELVVARPGTGGSKAVPSGPGLRQSAANWADLAAKGAHLTLLGDHRGAFMRTNPVDGSHPGSGAHGATKDKDIAVFRYMLVEHDAMGKEQQIHLLSSLSLPIAAIFDSGRTSIHALVKLDAGCAEDFLRQADAIYSMLTKVFGFDPNNKNPSRLTRAPGITRQELGLEPQLQTLLYLNPNPSQTPIKLQ